MNHAVITGGTGGLGGAIVRRLEDCGWAVEAPGSRELDVESEDGIRTYFSGRRVSLLVCCAGITRDAPLGSTPEAAWDKVIGVNYEGARRCASAVLPGMREQGCGHVIFISSRSAIHPPRGQAAYAAAKAALLGLTKELAATAGPDNIRVNAILPGFLETRMTASVSGTRKEQVIRDHALGRLNTAEAVADFIHHLHQMLPHTSGQVFQLDSRL